MASISTLLPMAGDIGVTSMILIAVVIGVVMHYLGVVDHIKLSRRISKLPGRPGWPILGHALELNVPAAEVFKTVVDKFCVQEEGMSYFQLGSQFYALLYKPETVEAIMSSNKHVTKSDDYKFMQPWLGTGLLTSAGAKWFARRRLLTPTFHFKILEDFTDVFNEQSLIMATKLQEAGKDGVNILPLVAFCALDIICETAMGKKIEAQSKKDSDYVKAIYRISELIQHRQVRPWFHSDFIYNYLTTYGRENQKVLHTLHAFTNSVIRQKKAELARTGPKESGTDEFGKKKRLAFLDLLLSARTEDGKPLEDEDLREEVDTFMFEGHDTTSMGVCWALWLLGLHPDVQKKVQEELEDIFGDSDRPVENEDLPRMKYLEICIKEALRLYPSVPFIARHIKEDVDVRGYKLPAGAAAFIVPYKIHRNPEHFTDPEKFDPERFLPNQAAGRHPFAYIPFSAGPRNCIGQKFAMNEEKVMLATVLRRLTVESMDKPEDVSIIGELILRPRDGLRLKFTPRK